MLSPPSLPPFLADRFELGTIEGVPSDEKVKIVHAVIRTLNDVASVPGLYDADLAMKLSGYLFSIQMVRYRDCHPMVVFPTNTTHTPPTLPAHISIALKPITGPPTDDDMSSVHTALRLSECVASVPSVFDANLNMKLSQHLFNLQFERYIHQTVTGPGSGLATGPQGDGFDPTSPIRPDNHTSSTENQDSVSSLRQPSVPNSEPASSVFPCNTDSIHATEPQTGINLSKHVKVGMADTNNLLVRIGEKLDDMKRFMVGAQHSMAKGWNVTDYSAAANPYHAWVSEQGKPMKCWGIYFDNSFRDDLVNAPDKVDKTHLAVYLQLYGIGSELIENEPHPMVKEDRKADAITAVRQCLGI